VIAEDNLPWWRHDRPWGFRFSWTDAAIFAFGIVATGIGWYHFDYLALFVPYLLAHFFLICNTFRIGGERSLIWVASFLACICIWTITLNLWLSLSLQEAVTLGLIWNCVASRNYHGIACERMNPNHFREGARSEGALTRRVLQACRLPTPVIEVLIGRKLNEFDSDKTSTK